ncbi:MAG: hypothetical protein FWD05_06695 [Oscillospiraceae bacterium]|nr:hypothetical protein [Oscillospiraceae bacterium]
MIWIIASKTKLYRLVAEHMYLPKMINTNYYEVKSTGSYYLGWDSTNGTSYRACYLFVNNMPRLFIQCKKKNEDDFINYAIHDLELENLVNRGMIRGVRSMRQLRSNLLLQQQEYKYIFGYDEYMDYTPFSQGFEHSIEAI